MGTYSFILLLLVIELAVVAGLFYLIYLLLRKRLAVRAQERRMYDPWPIFQAAWWGAPVCLLVLAGACFVPLFGLLAVILGCLYGAIRMPIDFLRWAFGRSPQALYGKLHPPSRLQFTMLDGYVAVFVYGCTLAFFAMPGPQDNLDESLVVFLAVLFMVGEGFAFYAGLDLLRRTSFLKGRLHRAVFLCALMAYSSILFPLTWVSWLSWRYALSQEGQQAVYTNPFLRKLAARNTRQRAKFRGARPGTSAPESAQPEVPPPLPPLEEPPPGATPSV